MSESSIGTSFAPPVTPFTPSSVASTPLSSISQPEAKKDSSNDNTISKEVDSPTNEKVANDSIANRAPGMAASEVKSTSVIAKRPTGRFMDVVRPSSVSTIQKPAAPAPSRTGTTIQPSPDLVDVISTNNRHSAVRKEMSDMASQSDNLSNAPDLKDVHNESTFAEIEDVSAEELSLTDKIAQSLAVSNSETSAAPIDIPLESPFIANVEVEKRPLGVVDQNVMESEADVEEDELESGSVDLEDMKLNHQYNSDLSNYNMSENSLGDASDSPMDLSPEIIAIEEAGVPEDSDDKMSTDIDSSLIESSELSEKEAMDSELTPMFDAVSTEVKPSAGKEKKKSGLLIALLIVLFLAIGMAGGAVSYFLLIK
ncbi:MAG: hypothetical protein HXL02_01410 [Candidatus Nanosynbacter sp.]|nr:hypothetical protein [Candidatus Nanosynbacter sp.]